MDKSLKTEQLYQITSPHFCAGIIADVSTGKVLRAAPIVKYMRTNGFDMFRVESYCQMKGWLIRSIDTATGVASEGAPA